jgi:hypothetical protein
VELQIVTLPPGARVLRSDTGESLGTTPLVRSFTPSEGELPLRIELAGYAPMDRAVSLAGDAALALSLVPEPRPTHPLRLSAAPPVEHHRILDPFAQ